MSDQTRIQINYKDLPHSDALEAHINKEVEAALSHHADRVTRVEVHVGDESSVRKHTPMDKRCMFEIRPAGFDPLSIEEHADDIFEAVSAASGKAKRALTRLLDKHDAR